MKMQTFDKDIDELNAQLQAGIPLEVDAITKLLAGLAVNAIEIDNHLATTLPGYIDKWAQQLAQDLCSDIGPEDG